MKVQTFHVTLYVPDGEFTPELLRGVIEAGAIHCQLEPNAQPCAILIEPAQTPGIHLMAGAC